MRCGFGARFLSCLLAAAALCPAAFLEESVAPRSRASANCGAALPLGSENIWLNPSLLAAGPAWEAGLGHRTYFGLEQVARDDLNLLASNRLASAGLGFSQFRALNIYWEQGLRLGLARRLALGIMAGAAAEGLRQQLPDPYATVWGISSLWGLAWQTRHFLLGAAVAHPPGLKKIPEEMGVVPSAALGASIGYLDHHRFTLEAESQDWQRPFVKIGQESIINRYLTLRLGYISNPARLCAGLEITYRFLGIAYSFQSHNELGPSHLLGVSFHPPE